MASSSNTKSGNINSEGTIKNDIKEGMKSTSNNNNNINEDDVAVFVAYNGKWEYEGKEWFFKNFKFSMMVVPKHITLSEITDVLYKQLQVDKEFYRLKLEVHYRTGSPWFPIIEIQNDQDLSVFISETSKTKLPLCVTQVYKGVREEIRKDDKPEKRLFNAIVEGDWVKAREIVNTEEVTWTSKLNDGLTALHNVVGIYRNNEFFREILMGINSEELLTIEDKDRSNLAHHAAAYDNTEALKIMLEYNPKCLFTANDNNYLAIHYALVTRAIKTFRYLFKQMKSYKDEYDFDFGDIYGLILLHQVIDTGLIDVAYELINDYPSLATSMYEDQTALECIIRKPELFYSGTSYGFYRRFVYHRMFIH